VRKGGQFVEQLLAVPAADELDQPVLGRRRDRLGADQLVPGHPLAEDPVSGSKVADVALDERDPRRSGLLLDPDRDLEAILGGGCGDQPLDRARGLALADDVADVESSPRR
jgi:hypothetical protein